MNRIGRVLGQATLALEPYRSSRGERRWRRFRGRRKRNAPEERDGRGLEGDEP